MSTRRRLRHRRQRRRRYSLTLKVGVLAVLAVAVGATTAAFTATNTVASSRIANVTHTISVPELTPANCNATFYKIVDAGGTNIRFETGRQNDKDQIWLGTSASDNMNGGPGVDCILPGGVPSGQTDATAGVGGTNYCYSGPGPGSYTFKQCSNTNLTGPYTTVASGPFS